MKITVRGVLGVLGALACGIVVLVVAAVFALHLLGERLLHRDRDVPMASIQVPADAASIAEGARLATIAGCRGCHGPELGGNVFFDGGPLIGRAVASNLSVVTAGYSDAQLAATIRYGVRPDGRGVLAMPSAMYYHYTDADLAAVIAYIRSVPAVDNPLPATRVGPLGRMQLLAGEFESDADIVTRLGPREASPDRADPVAWGRYIALITCTECHGDDLRGDIGTPSLAMGAAYSDEQFRHFMTTGEALGARQLRLMSSVARDRFSHLSYEEVGALHRYLRSMAEAD